MRVSIKDMASLQGIDPAFVETYLASKGWERVTNIPNKASIWAIGKDDPIQITLPTNRNFRDFPTRIGEVLQAIESVENRSQLFILTDLLNVNSDVVRIRIDTLKTTNNNLPIEDGFAVIQGAQNLLGATARAVVKPSPYFAGGKPAEVSTFLKNSLLGQAEPGSFVVTIIAPIKKTIEDPVQMSY